MVPYVTYTTTALGQTNYSTCDCAEDAYLSRPLPKKKQKFVRIMKMRNTDGGPFEYFLWKPVQMYNGRDNIGVRNFKKIR